MDWCDLVYGDWVLKEEFLSDYSKYCHKYKIKIENEKVIKETLEEKGVYDTRKRLSDGTITGSETKSIWVGIKIAGGEK